MGAEKLRPRKDKKEFQSLKCLTAKKRTAGSKKERGEEVNGTAKETKNFANSGVLFFLKTIREGGRNRIEESIPRGRRESKSAREEPERSSLEANTQVNHRGKQKTGRTRLSNVKNARRRGGRRISGRTERDLALRRQSVRNRNREGRSLPNKAANLCWFRKSRRGPTGSETRGKQTERIRELFLSLRKRQHRLGTRGTKSRRDDLRAAQRGSKKRGERGLQLQKKKAFKL